MIPTQWRKVKLGEVAEFINGRPFKPHEWSKSGLPIIRIQNLNGSKEYNYYQGEYSPKVLIKKGDLLFAWSGSRGTSFGPHIWKWQDGLLNYHTWKVEHSNEVDRLFLYFALKVVTARVENEAHGAAALVHMQKQKIVDFEIPVPPLPEQQKIATVLSTWDDAISKTDSLLTAFRQRKNGLVQRLLTGRVRFSGFDAKWRKAELGEFFYPFSKKNTENEDLTVLSCSTIHGIVPQTVIFGKRIASEDTRRYKVVERGDLIYDPMLLWDASIGFLEMIEKGVISPAYNTFKFKEDRGNREYFKYLLKTHYYRQHYKFISQGTNFRRRKAPAEAFLKLELILPRTREEQDKIVDVLKTCDQEVQLTAKKLEALKEQKKGLMQKLFTGQIRVKI